jgi:hypothetical protein
MARTSWKKEWWDMKSSSKKTTKKCREKAVGQKEQVHKWLLHRHTDAVNAAVKGM